MVHFSEDTGTSTQLSFIRTTGLHLGVLFYVWAFVILTSSSHSVNLTDGLDGLASGSSILVLAAFMFIAFWQFRHACGLGPPEALLRGRPRHRARRRDRGGRGDGGRRGVPVVERRARPHLHGRHRSPRAGRAVRCARDHAQRQLLLVVLGGLFVIETMSVIMQVISFRGFGRRIFRMSPIHHHFELAGWPEFTVIVRFWIIAGLCVAVGIGLFYVDFIAPRRSRMSEGLDVAGGWS